MRRGIYKYANRDFRGAFADFDYVITLDQTNPFAYHCRAISRVSVFERDNANLPEFWKRRAMQAPTLASIDDENAAISLKEDPLFYQTRGNFDIEIARFYHDFSTLIGVSSVDTDISWDWVRYDFEMAKFLIDTINSYGGEQQPIDTDISCKLGEAYSRIAYSNLGDGNRQKAEGNRELCEQNRGACITSFNTRVACSNGSLICTQEFIDDQVPAFPMNYTCPVIDPMFR